MQVPLAEFGVSPTAIAMEGGAPQEALIDRLKKLASMPLQGGPDLPAAQHLGLPLAAEAAARLAERLERERLRGITDEALALRAAEQRRATTAKFLAEEQEKAEIELGPEGGQAEFMRALAEVGIPMEGRLPPAELDLAVRHKVQGALSQARWKRQEAAEIAARRQAEEDARLAAIARCRGQLEDAALAHFRRHGGARDPAELARLWLKSHQPAIGTSPREYATHGDRLARCLGLLAASAKGRR